MNTGLYMPTFGDRATFGDESERPDLWNGLVGLWAPPLGVSGLKLFDVSGHHNHGTLTNMDPATDWIMSPYGWALDFDGAGDYIDCGQKLLTTPSKSFSVLVWAKRDTSNYGGLVSKDIGTVREWLLCENVGTEVRARIYQTNGVVRNVYGNYFPVGVWTQLGFIVDCESTKYWLIVNGKSIDKTGAWDGTVRNSTIPLRIGFFYSTGYTFDGQISGVSIWNRVLLPAEIADLYADPFAMLRRRQVVIPSGVNRRRRVLIGAA